MKFKIFISSVQSKFTKTSLVMMAVATSAILPIAAMASPTGTGGSGKSAGVIEPFPEGARVVFFGDSITQHGVAVTWVAAHYMKMFPNGNVRFFNVGISGGSVGAAHLYFDSWLAPLKPTHVVVGFGVNDAGATVFRKGAKDKAAELKRIESVAVAFETRYCKLLDRIEALGAKVILRTPTPYDELSQGPTAAGKTRVNAQAGRNDAQRRMAESVRKIAAARKLPLVDDFAVFSPWMNGEDVPFEADRVHPNKLGLWRLARNLLSAQGLEIEGFKAIDEVAEEVGLTAWRAASVRLSNLLSAVRQARNVMRPYTTAAAARIPNCRPILSPEGTWKNSSPGRCGRISAAAMSTRQAIPNARNGMPILYPVLK